MSTNINQPEPLQEFVHSGGAALAVNREQGVLKGVKLLGLSSLNGRSYREAALAKAAPLYEGAKVNVNHSKAGPAAPRDYQDRLGSVRGVKFRPGEGLFGDLHFNPKHTLSEQLLWDAEHAPQQVGLSHNVLARTKREGDQLVVEAITKVESVDLVADPATTRGLFEQVDRPLTVASLREYHGALVESIEAPLRERVDELANRETRLKRQVYILETLSRFGLPLPTERGAEAERITSIEFLATLYEASSNSIVESRIADRAEALRIETEAASMEQTLLPGPTDDNIAESTAQFVAAVLR